MQPVTAWSSEPSMARAPAEAPIRPDRLAAEKVLSRVILRFEPAAEKRQREQIPLLGFVVGKCPVFQHMPS